jgi:hypothetical protein
LLTLIVLPALYRLVYGVARQQGSAAVLQPAEN